MKHIGFIIVACMLCLISCKEQASDEKRNSSCGGILRLPIDSDISTLYPPAVITESEKQVVSHFHIGLFKYNSQNTTLEPGLCRYWDIDNTGKVYVFYLDSTAYFHNDNCFEGGKGRNITAYDVEFSFYNLSTQSQYNKNFTNTVSRILGAKEYYRKISTQQGEKNNIEGIQVLDKYTIKIILETPSVLFLYNLAHPAASILPHEGIQKYETDCKIGAGPFIYDWQRSNEHIMLTRNKQFFMFDDDGMRLPYLDSLLFIKTKTQEDAIQKFLTNQTDAALYIETETIQSIIERKQDSIAYKLTKSYANLEGNNTVYNITNNTIQDLHTNSLHMFDVTKVFLKK